ncbi:uncharacterized protein AAEQ78_007293 [Lycaon pictus]
MLWGKEFRETYTQNHHLENQKWRPDPQASWSLRIPHGNRRGQHSSEAEKPSSRTSSKQEVDALNPRKTGRPQKPPPPEAAATSHPLPCRALRSGPLHSALRTGQPPGEHSTARPRPLPRTAPCGSPFLALSTGCKREQVTNHVAEHSLRLTVSPGRQGRLRDCGHGCPRGRCAKGRARSDHVGVGGGREWRRSCQSKAAAAT